MIGWLGRLLGIDGLSAADQVQVAFAAVWASSYPLLMLLALAGLGAVAVVFYRRYQPSAPGGTVAMVLAGMRAGVLVLVALLLAEPVLRLKTVQQFDPLLVLLFDGTESMQLRDPDATQRAAALGALVADGAFAGAGEGGPTRAQLVQAVVEADRTGLFRRLDQRFRVRAYRMNRPDGLEPLDLAEVPDGRVDPRHLASQLDGGAGDTAADGPAPVTAYGAALDDLLRRHQSHHLAGVVVFGDFAQNTGPSAVTAARRLGRPVFAVGLGPTEVTDLSLDMAVPAVLMQGEPARIPVRIRQSGLDGQVVQVQLFRRAYGTVTPGEEVGMEPAGEAQRVTLDAAVSTVTLPMWPLASGRYRLEARAEPLAGETVIENNRSGREVTVRERSLRVLFVEYRPTWAWRYVKDLLREDPLVGPAGFRTFLWSSSLEVRRADPMFLESLVLSRSQLFRYDLVILSDLPRQMLSETMQQMLREYVGQLGGGLVVMAGPLFGPQAMADTPLAGILPVVPAPDAVRVDGPFMLRRVAGSAGEGALLRLDEDPALDAAAWAEMGPLPWYQPVLRAHPLAVVLATHPTDRVKGSDDLQPLVATRRFGRGEVVYLGTNELWRLRRLGGDRLHHRFWSGLVHRLGTARAAGVDRRFVVRTDRQSYRSGEKVVVTVEAYSEQFGPLALPRLSGRLMVTPVDSDRQRLAAELVLPLVRDGVVFEAEVPVFAAGRYRVVVDDPVTGRPVERGFEVSARSIERRRPTRDVALQRQLADQTGGAALELSQVDRLERLIDAQPVSVTTDRTVALGSTWLVMGLVLALLFGEWLIRKLVDMR